MMNHIRCRTTVIVGCLLLIFLPGTALALDPARSLSQYASHSWTRQVGLPANGINAITQTKDGFLWLGTQKGLARFDGVEFAVLHLPQNPLFRFQVISTLCPSSDGGLWFGIQNGAFGHYRSDTGFTTLPEEPWLNPWMNVSTLHEAGDGSLWVAGTYPVTRFICGHTNLTQPFTNEQTCITIFEDSSKRIWLGTSNQRFHYWENGRLLPFPDRSLTNEIVFAMAEDPQHHLWVGTQLGLRCYDAALHRVETPALNSKVTALLTDRHGVLWIGTASDGLWRWKDGRFDAFQKTDGLADDHVNTLFEDREGSLWVGTRDGLTQLYDVRFPLYSKSEGFADASYHGVCVSASGGVWATSSAGFSHFNGRKTVNYSQEVGLNSTWLKMPFEASNGDLYLSNAKRQVEIFAQGKIVARYSYHNEWITAFTEDAQGVVLSVGDTLLRANRQGLKPFEFPPGQTPSFLWIRNLAMCRDGTLLVASVNGIYRIKNGHGERLGVENGLPVNETLWACEDDEGVIWAGLAGGLARIKGSHVNAFTCEQGLFDDYISAIVPDKHGWLWLQSGQGIFRISRRSLADVAEGGSNRLSCLAYDGLESVKTTEISDLEHSACQTADGRIWFPSPQGLVVINPDLVPTSSSDPRVHLLSVRINGGDWSWQQPVVVPPGKGELEVNFTAATFIAPQKVQFRYMLAGYGENWVDAGTRRSAFFTNLKPGAYRFQVQACNLDGLWGADTDGFNLLLQPHYYQTTWFLTLAGALFLFLLFGFYLWRVGHLRRKQKRLQKINQLLEIRVQQRTLQLAGSNASLQTEIEERKRMELEVERIHKQLMDASRQAGQAEVAASVLHNVGNVLNSVNVSTTIIEDRLKNLRPADLGRAVELLKDPSTDLGRFHQENEKGRQFLSYLDQLTQHLSRAQTSLLEETRGLVHNIEHIKAIVQMQQAYAKLSGVTETVAVADLVESALKIHASAYARHSIKIVRDYKTVPPATVDRHKVLHILVNLLHNAKNACEDSHGTEKRVTVQIKKGQTGVILIVTDNGLGIPPENLRLIFAHGFTTRKDGHGFGLHSAALAAKELGGVLTAQSDGPGRGATFILELPLEPPGPV